MRRWNTLGIAALSLISQLTTSGTSVAAGVPSNCIGFCANASSYLTSSSVETIIARAYYQAIALGKTAVTIAVVDRVGNVLGVFQSKAALNSNVVISSGRFAPGIPPAVTLQKLISTYNNSPTQFKPLPAAGLEQVSVPATYAAISKAITAAYLSSEGNAFSTSTASQIIQQYFNPGEKGQPAGPLFGVQFSQLPCGDLVTQGTSTTIGPHSSPLGFAGDPGGLPLYFQGTPVGGIGVVADDLYTIVLNLQTDQQSIDEQVALAGSLGFEAPSNRVASQITVNGLTLRYLTSKPTVPVAMPANYSLGSIINAGKGQFSAVPGFYDASSGAQTGVAFGQPASGITPADNTGIPQFKGINAYILSDGNGNNRYPPINGAVSKGQQLTANDVAVLLGQAIRVANQARAQIRRPLGSAARMSIAVVDTNGTILGILRSADSPVFSTDVAVQKARTTAFFTNTNAAYSLSNGNFSSTVHLAQAFVPAATSGRFLADGTALTPRALGNLARPLFPDGIPNTPYGPFSLPYQDKGSYVKGYNQWSPFNIGFQLNLVGTDFLYSITNAFVVNPDGSIGANPAPVAIKDCSLSNQPGIAPGRLANGIQTFAGAVPIYKHGVFVGAIGESGDGIDQDDMMGFLGVYNAGLALGGTISNAPAGIRSNKIILTTPLKRVALRYVQCPFKPFNNSDAESVCGGK